MVTWEKWLLIYVSAVFSDFLLNARVTQQDRHDFDSQNLTVPSTKESMRVASSRQAGKPSPPCHGETHSLLRGQGMTRTQQSDTYSGNFDLEGTANQVTWEWITLLLKECKLEAMPNHASLSWPPPTSMSYRIPQSPAFTQQGLAVPCTPALDKCPYFSKPH